MTTRHAPIRSTARVSNRALGGVLVGAFALLTSASVARADVLPRPPRPGVGTVTSPAPDGALRTTPIAAAVALALALALVAARAAMQPARTRSRG